MSSFIPRDLSIHIQATARSNLVLNGGPKGATFPGWFITVQDNEGYNVIAGPQQLSFAEVKVITDVIDRTIDKTDRSHWRVTNAAQRCETAMRNDLARQLEDAERVAAKIPELRARLGYDVSDT
jgi:hypothetical protein